MSESVVMTISVHGVDVSSGTSINIFALAGGVNITYIIDTATTTVYGAITVPIGGVTQNSYLAGRGTVGANGIGHLGLNDCMGLTTCFTWKK